MKSDISCKRSTTPGTQLPGAPSHQPLLNTTCLKNINDLPDSLLVEILCRLPCKFVVRCKCVCKSWSTLISLPYFESRRALYIKNNCDNEQVPMFVPYCHTFPGYGPAGFLTFSKQSSSPGLKLKPLDFDPSSLFPFDHVVAAYNDLLLLRRPEYHERKDIYYICNPYTKQWVALPHAPSCEGKDVRVGFACDSNNRCCKVVRLLLKDTVLEPRSLNYPEKLEVQIFSSDDETGNKWTESYLVLQGSYKSCDSFDSIKTINSIDAGDTPVAHNGTLYWVTRCGNLIALELFSSTTCQGRFISRPPTENFDRVGKASLSVCQGFVRLSYLVRAPESPENRYDTLLCVWELKEDEQWCFKELVDLRPFESSFPMMRHLVFDPNDQDILYQWRKPPSSATADIVMCNIRKLTLTEISDKFKACGSLNSFVFVLPWWRWPTPVPRLN